MQDRGLLPTCFRTGQKCLGVDFSNSFLLLPVRHLLLLANLVWMQEHDVSFIERVVVSHHGDDESLVSRRSGPLASPSRLQAPGIRMFHTEPQFSVYLSLSLSRCVGGGSRRLSPVVHSQCSVRFFKQGPFIGPIG